MNNLLVKKLRWLNLPTNAQMKTLNTTSKNVVTFLVSVHKSITLMIQKAYFTIYFKKSSNTRAPPSREVMTANNKYAPTKLTLREIVLKMTAGIRTKGQMPIHSWAVLDQRIRLWQTLICKMVPECQTPTITHTLSSRNCIEELYNNFNNWYHTLYK